MSRQRRLSYEGAIHHVTLRCNNKEFLFDDQSLRLFMCLLSEACQKYKVDLFDYCLMTNHVHLNIQVRADDALSRFMHWQANMFAKRFNAIRGRNGHLWEGRFHSTIVEPGFCVRRCMPYIDLNPVRAGMVQTPADYQWSGHLAIAREDQSLISLCPEYLALADSRAARYRAYCRIIKEEAARKPLSLANVLFLGSQEFTEGMVDRFKLDSKSRPRIWRTHVGDGAWIVEPMKGGSSRCLSP